jgi:Fe-S-cluster containining protein
MLPELETDLAKIELMAELRKEENQRFRRFLKGHTARKMDQLVHKLHDEIAPKIDCTKCGNCCRNLSPGLTKEDLRNLSHALNLSPAETVEKYTETDEMGELSLKHLPCIFLKENKCTVYAHRPETCASFPHMHKPEFISRLRRVADSYAICPIIYNVFERMKLELHFE